MPTQNCNSILVTYQLVGEEPVTVEVESSGTNEGKPTYDLSVIATDLILIWYSAYGPYTNVWAVETPSTTESVFESDTECPFGTYTIEEGSIFEAFIVHPVINNPYAESINCYKLLVWKKQCEFSKCVLKYLRNLQFGIFNCNELEHLKNKRRVLNILNRYDARDILNNTTEYNTITYAEIQALLNY
jgi:hypothetical protein